MGKLMRRSKEDRAVSILACKNVNVYFTGSGIIPSVWCAFFNAVRIRIYALAILVFVRLKKDEFHAECFCYFIQSLDRGFLTFR